jgi:hypothetical protein
VHNQLDLHGTGERADVILPFIYLYREPGVRYDLIVEGGYKIYDLAKKEDLIAIIGPLDPCIGIAVTDGKKLLLFHKHVLNSVSNMLEIIKNNLDLSCPENLVARIFTTADAIADTGELPTNDVASIKNALSELLRVPCASIIAEIFPLYVQEGAQDGDGASVRYMYPEGALGNYVDADLYVAVKLSDLFVTKNGHRAIQFFSISPCEINFFDLAPDLAPEAKRAAYRQLHDAYVADFYERVVGMSAVEIWERAGQSPFFCVPFQAMV